MFNLFKRSKDNDGQNREHKSIVKVSSNFGFSVDPEDLARSPKYQKDMEAVRKLSELIAEQKKSTG